MPYFDLPSYGSGQFGFSQVAGGMAPSGGAKQYAADDRGVGAMEQRRWWEAMRNPPRNPLTSASGAGTSAATDPNKPTVESLSAVKNPAFSGPQKSLLEDFNLGREAGNRGFADYLAEANRLNAQAKTDLERDRSALDTGDFAARLAGIRNEQKANLLTQRDELLRSRAGERERAMATSGLPSGMSSELENRSLSAWLLASLPVQQQILGQEAADAELLQRMNMGTAGQRTALGQGYLNTLLGPERARQSLLGGYINTLGGIQNLDQANTFYEKLVSQPYRNNVPVLPVNTVSGAGYVPAVRSLPPLNFGLGNRGGAGGGNGGGGGGARQRSYAEQAYFEQTGKWPQGDPFFNPELYEALGGRVGQQPAYNPMSTNWDEAQRRAQEAQTARAWSDYYANQTDRGQFADEDNYFNNLP